MPTPFNSNPLDDSEAQFSRSPTNQPKLDDSEAQFSRSPVHAPILDDVRPVIYQIPVVNDAVKYRLFVFDTSGNLTMASQDILEGSFEDVVNGGSGQATIKLPRRFVDQGWIGHAYRVQFFIDDTLGDPWYDGRVTEIDPEEDMSGDYETITVHAEGWHNALNDTVVSEVLSPGVQPNGVNNGPYAADTYLLHLISTYMDSSKFAPAFVSAIPIGLDKITFDGTGLGDCIDQVVQQVLSNTGQLFEWWVRGQVANGGKPAIVIQQQSNPDNVTTNYYSPSYQIVTQFITKAKNSDIYGYKIQNSSRDLYNMIALYGGTDPNTGLQVYGVFKDSTSISLYGLRQKKVTNTSLVSTASLGYYATAYLLLNAYPQPQGSFKLFRATDFARSGQWFQIYEPGLTATNGNPAGWIINSSTKQIGEHPPNLKQIRAIRVVTTVQQQDRIEQEVFVTAPRPFIDQDYYAALDASATKQAGISSTTTGTNLATIYIQTGGVYVSNT